MLDLLHEPRFADQAPAEVYARLLDENRYLCSERTMYQFYADNAEVESGAINCGIRPTRNRLLATAPNQVWSWDITKLLGPAKWTYLYLYVVLDIFSRYVVGLDDRPPRAQRSPSSSKRLASGKVTAGQLAIR